MTSHYPSGTLWALRHAEEDPLAFLEALARSPEAVVPFQLGTRTAFLLNHPTAIEDVFVAHADRFTKGPGFARAKRLLGEGLLTADALLHHERRGVLQPAFGRELLASYAPTVVAHASRIRARWEPRRVVEIEREMRELTLGIAGETLFGADLAGVSGDIVAAVADAVPEMDGLVSLVASARRVQMARHRLDAVIDDVVQRRRQSVEGRADLLSLLIGACDIENDASVRQLRDDAVTFLLAGHDTIAHALTWAWVLLADHPAEEHRLRAELVDVLGGRLPVAEDLPRLAYTRSVIAETLRLRPPAWVIVRQAVKAHRCGDVEIPARSLVVASPFVTHRDNRFFLDPLTFSPERWLSPAPRPRLAYFPFGAGPRACIGEGFAWMEGTLTLATLASRWRLALAEGTVRANPRITLRPRGPVPMVPTAVGI